MEARPLPPHPSLEQYRKQAKDLLKVCRSADAALIREWAAAWFDACAGEWIETEARLRGVDVTPALRLQLADEIVDRVEKDIRGGKLSQPDPKLADAQFFIARGHGFGSWTAFARQIQTLRNANSPDAKFEAAADAIVSGDIRALRELLHENPALVTARSGRTHHGTLLQYVAANGVEDFRQKTPENIVEIAKVLLDAGADTGGSSILGLVATSVHVERAGVQEQLLQLLLHHGGTIQSSTIEACLHNGHGKAARFLAERGAPLNLETAAGCGLLDQVRSLTAPGRQLQRGFLWACEYGHYDVVKFLLDSGADLRDQADTNETALHWAVVAGDVNMITLLLDRGAPLEELNAYGGTALGQAGWSFVNGDPRIDYVPVFDTLLAAGAKIEDGFLAWLERQQSRSATKKAAVADVVRRYC